MKAAIIILLLVISYFEQGGDEYVCLPCGQGCDHTTYSGPGTCGSCGMELVKKSSIKFKNIDIEEMCKRIKANPSIILLDVRSPGEFDGSTNEVPSFGHFKNAINVNVRDLEARIDELAKYKTSEVIVYCSHSHRSPRASYLLGTRGFTNVKNMSGGVSTFAEKSACLEKEFVFHTR
ncbi:MAG TPA: rhodanese-like domain-containing protein [Cyclobacteriaceae bacterium]|nr:rhodanese-like domain-containing protein [Cyclobacteriaceae bacterium]